MRSSLALLFFVSGCSALFDGNDLRGAGFNSDGGLDLSMSMDDGGPGGDGSSPFTLSFTPMSFAFGGATNAGIYNLALGDLNGDGKLDIAGADYDGNQVVILLGKGDGTFPTVVDVPVCKFHNATTMANADSPFGIAIGDILGDSKLDVVVSCDPSDSSAGSFTILTNTGTGSNGVPTFTKTDYSANNSSLYDLRLADVDKNGKLDIVVLDRDQPTGVADPNTSYFSVYYQGTGGTFTGTHYSTSYNSFFGGTLDIGDFDKDGRTDVVAQLDDGDLRVFINRASATPAGIFTTTRTYVTAGSGTQQVIAGDLDKDSPGDDLITVTSSNTLRVLLNPQMAGQPFPDMGVFMPPTLTHPTDVNPLASAIGDFNQDGNPDIAVTCYIYNQTASDVSHVDIFLGDGMGNLAQKVTLPDLNDFSGEAIAAADLNGDGLTDLVVGDSTAQGRNILVLLNTSH
jgi:hypothetical protein